MNKEEIYSFLTAQGVPFEKTEHGVVYNMEQLAALKLPYPDREGKICSFGMRSGSSMCC